MFRWCLFISLMFLLSCHPLHKRFPVACQPFVRDGRFLTVIECVEETPDVDGNTCEAFLDALSAFAKKQLVKGRGSLVDQQYWFGFLAWLEGDILAARNHWFQYLGMCPQTPFFSVDERRSEVEFHYDFVNFLFSSPLKQAKLQKAKAQNNLEVVVKPAVEVQKKGAKRTPVKKRIPFSRASFSKKEKVPMNPALSVPAMVAKANLARQNGQLEMAMRLYELALKMDPGSDAIRKEIRSVWEEIQ